MNLSVLLVSMALLLLAAFMLGRGRSLQLADRRELRSLPYFYGMLTLLWTALPGVLLFGLWLIFESSVIEHAVIQALPQYIREDDAGQLSLVVNQVYNLAYSSDIGFAPDFMLAAANRVSELETMSRDLRSAVVLSSMTISAGIIWRLIHPRMSALERVEYWFRFVLIVCSSISVFATIGIIFSVLAESLRFFSDVPIHRFLFGLHWSPQSAFHEDQVGLASFGAVPLFVGTLSIAGIAMFIAVPVGLMAAVYLSEYAHRRVRSTVKPMLEILAGVPTVVYGFIAALTVAPFVRDIALSLGLDNWVLVSSESALAAGIVMGVMIIPFISSIADDVINAVPQGLRDSSLTLGATSAETVIRVVIPAALPGIVGGIMLAASRAIGETMIVVMAAGLAANLTLNPLDSVTTVTVQIVGLLVGDQEFNSPKTLAAFALGLVLFLVTLSLNYIALHVVRRYREQYE